MLNLFKKSEKKSKIQNFAANVEKLDAKELKQVVGGSINYNASKSNTGNSTAGNNLGGSTTPSGNNN